MIATAKNDCAAVRNSSSRWIALIGRPCQDALEIANTIGSVPTSSVHWFTFEETSVPRAGVRVQTPREQAGDQELRRLRGERREPLDQEELVDAELLAGVDEGLRERMREEQDHDSRRRGRVRSPRRAERS